MHISFPTGVLVVFRYRLHSFLSSCYGLACIPLGVT